MKTYRLVGPMFLMGALIWSPLMAQDASNPAQKPPLESGVTQPEQGKEVSSGRMEGQEKVDSSEKEKMDQDREGKRQEPGEAASRAPGDVKSTGEKAASDTGDSTTKTPGAIKDEGKKDQVKGVAGGAETRDGGKGAAGSKPPDRRWIIKEPIKKGSPPRKPALAWKDEKQKARCEAYLPKLKSGFLDARYYSIQGDSCATAEHAGAFLNTVEVCGKECPEGFLQQNGYTDDVIRNLDRLHKLGKDRCLK